MKAMILAAGRGERMRPLTDQQPKPLLSVADLPLLDYHLMALAAAGVTQVVINLAWQGRQIQDWVEDGKAYGLQVTYSDEGDEALETGGGIQRALPLLGDQAFWLVNGDIYCDYAFAPRALAADDLAHLVLVPSPDHHPQGDFCLTGQRVAVAGSPRLTYSGIALLSPDLFANQQTGRFPLAPLLVAAMEKESVSGELYSGLWADVGTPERLASLDKVLRQQN